MRSLAALTLALAGCYSFTVVGRARTVARGHAEWLAAPALTAIATLDGDPNVRPAIEVGARYGVSDRVDVGARIGDSGASATVRNQLVRAPSPNAGIELLLAPGLAYTLTDKLAVELPCLVGINLPGSHQIVIAPRVVYQLRFGVGGLDHPAQFVFAGGSIGFAWQVASSVALFPEIALLTNVYAEPGFGTFAQAGPALQASIGVLWDR